MFEKKIGTLRITLLFDDSIGKPLWSVFVTCTVTSVVLWSVERVPMIEAQHTYYHLTTGEWARS